MLMKALTMKQTQGLINLPTPKQISYLWNGGSLLGFTLMIQIITGLFLASYYCSSISLAFESTIHISRNVSMGWLIRTMHMNGASMFFVFVFIHIARGLMYSSFKLKKTWTSGVIILFLLMATAFLGYVLPWGQMSFWGATVITNLLSAIPYLGNSIVKWLWGGFSVNQSTLSRFFMLHFLLPFVISTMVMIHLIFLHDTGSNNPSKTSPHIDKTTFTPLFIWKDLLTILISTLLLIFISCNYPLMFSDPENFNQANPLNTPIHIQPEWYFLFAYAILRSIPNKLGGVISLVFSIAILLMFPFSKNNISSLKNSPIKKIIFSLLISSFLVLTWIGANPVEAPFESIGKLFSMTYFMLIMLMICFFLLFWKQLIKFLKSLQQPQKYKEDMPHKKKH